MHSEPLFTEPLRDAFDPPIAKVSKIRHTCTIKPGLVPIGLDLAWHEFCFQPKFYGLASSSVSEHC